MSKALITHRNVKDRDYKRGGVIHEGASREGHHVEVKPGEYIRLYGAEKRPVKTTVLNGDWKTEEVWVEGEVPYDITFRVGDTAEYGSYNLHYLGEVVSISAKTVSILPEHGTKVKRLRLYEFSWRNDNFDLEKIRARNLEESMCI